MKTEGKHLLLEFSGCSAAVLTELESVRAALFAAAEATEATVVGEAMHRFLPRGVTGILLLRESHLSIHTWPDEGYAAVDVYTCGKCLSDPAIAVMAKHLRARQVEILSVDRGHSGQPTRMTVATHETRSLENLLTDRSDTSRSR